MKLREQVRLDGIPLVWETNLPNEDIRAFYLHLLADSDFANPTDGKIEVAGLMSLSVRIFSKLIEFKDGHCHCFGVNESLTVIYRTANEWQIWEARQNEIRELKEEQELEHEVESLVFRTEDAHLKSRISDCITVKDYDEAARLFRLRAELRKHHPEIKGHLTYPGYLVEEALWTFSAFPEVKEGTQFLHDYAGWSSPFLQFARRYRSLHSNDDKNWKIEVDKIFHVAVDKFPDDGFMHKEICLFWEREHDLERAIGYCKIAASRSLRDDTKTGFAGRLLRLQKKIPVAPEADCHAVVSGRASAEHRADEINPTGRSMLRTKEYLDSLGPFVSGESADGNWQANCERAVEIAIDDIRKLQINAEKTLGLPLLHDTQFDWNFYTMPLPLLGSAFVVPDDAYLSKTNRGTLQRKKQSGFRGHLPMGLELEFQLHRAIPTPEYLPDTVLDFGIQMSLNINPGIEFKVFREIYRNYRGAVGKLLQAPGIEFFMDEVVAEIENVRSKKPIDKLDAVFAQTSASPESLYFQFDYHWLPTRRFADGFRAFRSFAILFTCIQKLASNPRAKKDRILDYVKGMSRAGP